MQLHHSVLCRGPSERVDQGKEWVLGRFIPEQLAPHHANTLKTSPFADYFQAGKSESSVLNTQNVIYGSLSCDHVINFLEQCCRKSLGGD